MQRYDGALNNEDVQQNLSTIYQQTQYDEDFVHIASAHSPASESGTLAFCHSRSGGVVSILALYQCYFPRPTQAIDLFFSVGQLVSLRNTVP